MGRNVKGSRSWSVPRAERNRRELALTLAADVRAELERVAQETGLSKSAIVDELVRSGADVLHRLTRNTKNRTK